MAMARALRMQGVSTLQRHDKREQWKEKEDFVKYQRKRNFCRSQWDKKKWQRKVCVFCFASSSMIRKIYCLKKTKTIHSGIAGSTRHIEHQIEAKCVRARRKTTDAQMKHLKWTRRKNWNCKTKWYIHCEARKHRVSAPRTPTMTILARLLCSSSILHVLAGRKENHTTLSGMSRLSWSSSHSSHSVNILWRWNVFSAWKRRRDQLCQFSAEGMMSWKVRCHPVIGAIGSIWSTYRLACYVSLRHLFYALQLAGWHS